MKYLKHFPHDTYRISHYNERLFFTDIRNARRKTIDLIFKVLKPEVKNAFISVIEWPRIPAWYLKGEKCPLCNTDLRPASTIERIKKFDKAANDVKNKHQAEYWLAKVEYHS